MVSKAFARSSKAMTKVPLSFFCFCIKCSSRTELTALVSLFASIFVYSLRSTLLIDNGHQLLMFCLSVAPFGRSRDLLAFSFSSTLPIISHTVYIPARNPGVSSAFRLTLSTVIWSGSAAEPVRITLTAFLTLLAITASSNSVLPVWFGCWGLHGFAWRCCPFLRW